VKVGDSGNGIGLSVCVPTIVAQDRPALHAAKLWLVLRVQQPSTNFTADPCFRASMLVAGKKLVKFPVRLPALRARQVNRGR
jgi:hypothetical protein